jgi:hypothetical protein
LERRQASWRQEAPKQRQIWAVRFFLDREGRMRDRALFDLAIDSKLRGCDLVKIKIGTLVTGHEILIGGKSQQRGGRFISFQGEPRSEVDTRE